MFHYFESITNTSGDALVGYFVKAVSTTSGDLVDIYADSSGTAIETVSGITNTAEVDGNGNVSFYVPGGTYHLDIYAADSTTFVLRLDDVQMVDFATLSTTGIGYAVGAGGTVTQLTSKSTGVTINTLCGQIVMHSASLAGGASVGFTVSNTQVTSTDVVVVNFQSTPADVNGLLDYSVRVGRPNNGFFVIVLKNETGGALATTVTLNFAVIKSVNA